MADEESAADLFSVVWLIIYIPANIANIENYALFIIKYMDLYLNEIIIWGKCSKNLEKNNYATTALACRSKTVVNKTK